MKLAELLRQACSDLNISMSELARRTGQSPQNLSMKLKRDTIPFKEFLEYMDALGIKADLSMVYPDGRVPETPVLDDRTREKIALLEASLELERRNCEYQRSLSSDIRTSLYNVQGYVDMALKNMDDSSKIYECLEKIKMSCNYLNVLFGDSANANANAKANVQEEFIDENIKPEFVRGKRVLVVEDNEMNREITKDVLEENGVLAECASNGEEALKLIMGAEPGYYDCILMDIQMPVMDGLEATKQIRALPNRIRAGTPIIAMTANAFEQDRKKAVRAGMDSYLSKPIETRKMINAIAKYV